MAVPPFDGLPGDRDDEPDDNLPAIPDTTEGTVVPFPGSPPPPDVRKARFGEHAELRPILPEHLRTWAAARKHYGWHLKRGRHHTLYHLVRLPHRGWNTVRWAALGAVKLAWIEVNWWWVTEQSYLRSQAVRDNDPRTWESLHKHAIKRRAFRGGVVGAQAAAIALLIGCGLAFAPWWAWVLAALVVLPVLAWFGRPDDKPILTSATVPVAYETLSFEVIGSIPRMGKTFLLRLLLLICALDLRVEIHAYDLKGTGDLKPIAQVAHRYWAGDDPEDIEYLVADMRALRTEMRRRTRVIRNMDEQRCPENKVTPELAADPKLGLHPIAVALDECQVAFEHPEYGKELIAICTDLTKRGPALGIMLMLATQRPDATSIPTSISANAVLRMCLKVMGQLENDMVLGTSMYKNGVRATMFAREDKGVFYFAGEGLNPVIMRGYGFDLPASKVIAARARTMREAAGRLTGYALGEDADVEVRSIAEDVLLVFREDPKLYLTTIAARLAEAIPGAYADITPDAVASQLRNLGANSKKVREAGGPPLAGFERAAIIPLLSSPDV